MINTVPGYNLNGVQDLTGAVPIPDPETTPQHLPLVPLLMEKGLPEPVVSSANTSGSSFGSLTLDLTSPYATAATVLANTIIATGNQAMLRRMVPSGARTAFLRIAAELIAAQIPIYTRNVDGTIQLDNTGAPVTTGSTNGWRIVWWVNPDAMSAMAFGEASPIVSFRPSTTTAGSSSLKLGGLMDTTTTPATAVATTSTLYPVYDIPVAQGPGKYGNSYGLQVTAPTVTDIAPTNQILSQGIKSFLYRWSVATIPAGQSSSTVRQSLTGATYVDVALKPNQRDPKTNAPASINNSFVESYRLLDDPTLPDVNGYFGDMHTYDTNLATILTKITTTTVVNGVSIPGEGSYDAAATAYGRTSPYYLADPANLYQLNIFTGKDFNGAPYYALDVIASSLFGGVSFGQNTTVFAAGGDDGLVVDSTGTPDTLANWQILDELTRTEFSNFGTGEIQYFDALRYPITTIWDPGYSMDTKKAMINVMSLVKYIYIVLGTQTIADYDTSTPPKFIYSPINTAAQDIAVATELQSLAALAPESELYGTPACRAMIMGQAAKLLSKLWDRPLPLTLEMAKKVGDYMGAANGKWKNGKNFTESPLNKVELFGKLNYQWLPLTARTQAWKSGMINAQSAGRKGTFFAALRTIYPDDTSVLNQWSMVAACCYAELVSIRAWALLTGITGLTQKQFISRSNKIITDMLDQAFDGQFTVIVNTYFTSQDTNNNNSWTCKINFYANGMLVLGDFTIVANRYAALLALAA